MNVMPNNHIGYLFIRKNINNPKIKNLFFELNICLLEVNLIIVAFETFKTSNLSPFDNSVGDCKCQTRTSMLLDIDRNKPFILAKLQSEYNYLKTIQIKIKYLLNSIDFNNFTSIKKALIDLELSSLKDYLESKKLYHLVSQQMIFISLCYFISLEKNNIKILSNNFISSNKLNQLIVNAKKELCNLSIKYEQQLAKKYCSEEIQKSLEQIETKGICSMTAFFPSFKPIFEKLKHHQESILIKKTIFCSCGGIKKHKYKHINYVKNKFIETPININFDKKATIIQGYQFAGSLSQLKNILNIPEFEIYIPKQYHKPCACNKPIQYPPIQNIEETILANFAQHPQFTNDKEIDWKGLELVGSDIHQEYEYLKTLKGHSMDDMSIFCIDHIYPSTIKDALEQDNPSIIVNKHIPESITHIVHSACPC